MPDTQYEERTIKVNRVSKVVKGGRRFSFTALMVIGDGNGKVGLGYGKAKEAGLAVQKGIDEAKKSMFDVPLAGSTITHPVIGKAGAGEILLKPAAPGTGVIAGGAARAILEMAGVHDIIGSRSARRTRSTSPRDDRRAEEPAPSRRGREAPWLAVEDVAPAGMLRAYTERQRGLRLGCPLMTQLKVTQIKSGIGTKPNHRATLPRPRAAQGSGMRTCCLIARRSVACCTACRTWSGSKRSPTARRSPPAARVRRQR